MEEEIMYHTFGPLMSSEDFQYVLEVRRGFDPRGGLDRRVAAHILAIVAEAGESGNVNPTVTPEMIGAAIGRLVSNYPGDWLREFLRGLNAAR